MPSTPSPSLTRACVLALALVACGGAKVSAQTELPTLPEKQIDEIVECIEDLRKIETAPARVRFSSKGKRAMTKAKRAFGEAMEKARASMGNEDPLRAVSSWSEIFLRLRNGEFERQSAGGRVVDDALPLRGPNGKSLSALYAVRLPKRYDYKKTYPLILCIHAPGSDGKKYLNEVWDDTDSDLLDQVIVIAPTLGEEAPARRRSDNEAMEFMGGLYLQTIGLTLRHALTTYNVDADRIFIEGTGKGADAALQLAMFSPERWAGVIVRNGSSDRSNFLANLKGIPALFVGRTGGFFSPGGSERSLLDGQAKAAELDFAYIEKDALSGGDAKRALGPSGVDRMPDATAEVLAWTADKRRMLERPEFSFTTINSRAFRRGPWVNVTSSGANPSTGATATLNGKIDRERNALMFTTRNVERFEIYLNDRIVDLGKPVIIEVNGKKVQEVEVERSLDYALAFFRKNSHDPYQSFVAELQIEVPGAGSQEAEGESGG